MPLIPFPSVPNLPGVPALPRSPEFPPIVRLGLGVVQGTLLRVLQGGSQWGIFDSNGNALADPAQFTGIIGTVLDVAGLGSTLSTKSVEYMKEMQVSDFPVERGGFAQYNKVEKPAEPTVTLCLAGSENDRRTFLDAIDKATKSTELYSVVTPEVIYIEYTVVDYDYSRKYEKGCTLLTVSIKLKEIRSTSSSYTTAAKTQVDQPKDVGASPQVDSGKTQAKTPETSVLRSVFDKLGF